eukprot:15338763-Ditylum_brightwellii.AAC.1
MVAAISTSVKCPMIRPSSPPHMPHTRTQYTLYAEFFAMLWPQMQMQKLEHCTSMLAKVRSSEWCSKRWAIPSPPSPIMTDNYTAEGIVNCKVKQCRMHMIDMCFHWIRDHCQQGHFIVYWCQGLENL